MGRAADALTVSALGWLSGAEEGKAGCFDRNTLWALSTGMHAEERKARGLTPSSLLGCRRRGQRNRAASASRLSDVPITHSRPGAGVAGAPSRMSIRPGV